MLNTIKFDSIISYLSIFDRPKMLKTAVVEETRSIFSIKKDDID